MPEGSEPTRAELDQTIAAEPEAAELLGAIRELSARVGGLQTDVNALRAEAHPLPTEGRDAPGWDGRGRGTRDSLAWVRDLESPGSRRANVPWLLLEITFLAAVAVGCAVADLDWTVVVGVMAGAWALVALAEWTGAQAARRRTEAAYAPVAVYGQGFAPDPSWFAPPMERTVLDVTDEDTGTRLPPPSND